jgi:uncharacterized pyridoxamine 5'-phosphate oxidase family protein
MDMGECIRFANENPVAWVATTSGDEPRVRPLQVWFADTTGFSFQTLMMKDICREIMKNPRVELGFWRPGEGAEPYSVWPAPLSGWTTRP